ncbi:MAG: ribbon-helix-helix domain-containing protein [Clostridia bacterium]|nr:ribbon-helix-helix domain-containing protein [Spirochaetia bacterium]
MRIKTSVSLSKEILNQVSAYATDGERSEFIEKALRQYIEQLERHERNVLDLNNINAAASYLNSEAKDVLEYQVPL